MSIRVLSPQVVSKIAAGEVIERPASVVKELIENALDAHATSVAVEVQNGGVRQITVTDNGCGIAATDVELAFKRHATSKISSLDDLDTINSLGFRGEALSSIAAVSDLEIVTQAKGEPAGICLSIKEEEIVGKGKCSRSPGTTITVNHLFRTVPARLKFLKSDATESSHISNVVVHYALAFPAVRFSFAVDGRRIVQTPGNGVLRDAVAEVHNLEIARQLIEVRAEEGEVIISGLAGPAYLNRTNRSYISVFVNHRWIRSVMLTRAIEEAYHGLLMIGRHPVAVINITLPPGDIDVNVHPTKSDVRFRDANSIFSAVQKAVRSVAVDAPLPSVSRAAVPASPVFGESEAGSATPLCTRLPEQHDENQKGNLAALPILRVVWQLSASYILAEGPEGLYLIDQHAAHERIMFEKITKQRAEKKVEIQGLLDPVPFEMTREQDSTLKNTADIIRQFGFILEPFGDRTYLLRAVPALLGDRNLIEGVISMLDELSDKKSAASSDERIAISLACHSAVRAGQVLSSEEMRALMRALEESSQPRTCPHGRPTMILLSSRQLQREFGRTG